MFSKKNVNREIITVVCILLVVSGAFWMFSSKTVTELPIETQKQENPVAPTPESVNPDDFREVTLDSRFEYYIKAGGKITLLSDMSSEVTIVVLPGTLHHEAQTLPKNPENKMVYGNYGDYAYTFNAPQIPGLYNGVIVTRTNDKNGKKPENKNFKLVVINDIKNEAEAYAVAEHFLKTKTFTVEDATIKGWTLQKKEVVLMDEGWKFSLEFVYQGCGIDWKESVCVPRQSKATLLVRKNGIVEQIQ